MEGGAFKILESATQRTLHAHAFSRSSSQASLLLTDLLSRYLTLLTSTCARYAEHAGRTTLNVRDAVAALEELGVSLHELNNYCSTEGKELNRYALYSARRVEDIIEFKCMFSPEMCANPSHLFQLNLWTDCVRIGMIPFCSSMRIAQRLSSKNMMRKNKMA